MGLSFLSVSDICFNAVDAPGDKSRQEVDVVNGRHVFVMKNFG